MVRPILAAIVSYIVMAMVLFALFSAAYLMLGAECTFQTGTFQVSPLWLVLASVITFCGALVGGYVCAITSKSRRACQVLAGIVFLMSAVACIPAMREDPIPRSRAGEVSNLQAMQQAQSPMWMHVLSPFIGAAGVLLGARMKLRSVAS
jgi:membrane protease YdiL (CAAX protease family)